jgi:hypothetical protein
VNLIGETAKAEFVAVFVYNTDTEELQEARASKKSIQRMPQ